MWDLSVGGGVISGETSREAAKRELFEELGISYDFSSERPYLTTNFENGFDDIYFINLDLDINSVKLEKDEVQNVKWATREEIIQMINNETFLPFVATFIDSLFDMKNQRGMIRKYF